MRRLTSSSCRSGKSGTLPTEAEPGGRVIAIIIACIFLTAFPVSGMGEPDAHAKLVPGEKRLVSFSLEKRESRWIKSSGLSGYANGIAAIAVPDSFTPGMTYPILVTCVTGDRYLNNLDEIDKYWPVAVKKGWIVVTGWANPRPVRDTRAYRRAVTVAALRKLAEAIPQSRTWPLAVAGFSGGAKNAALTAAYLQKEGYRITGLFMGGCNEDLATYAMNRISPDKEAYRSIPVFLSVGKKDTISTVEQVEAVQKSMEESGFAFVKLEPYQGRHRLHQPHLPVALDWFKALWED